jgi:hypothetical protein
MTSTVINMIAGNQCGKFVEGVGGGNQCGWQAAGWVKALPAWRLGSHALVLWIGFGNAAELLALIASAHAEGREVHILAYAPEPLCEGIVLRNIVPLLVRRQLLPEAHTAHGVTRFGACSVCFADGNTIQRASAHLASLLLQAVSDYAQHVASTCMQPTHIYTAGNAAAAACAIDVAQLTSSMLCVHVTLVLVGHHRELSEEHKGMLSTAAAEGGLGSLTIHGRGGSSKPIHIHHFAPPARDARV